MSKRPRINFEKQAEELRKLLATGQLNATDACKRLSISQSTFSRTIEHLKEEVLVVGCASKTLYALKRIIPQIGLNVKIYAIDDNGSTSVLGTLHAIYPNGFYFEDSANEVGQFFDDFPYFMDDLRPNGFLGRLIPYIHPDLNLPKNINYWSVNDSLEYLSLYGYDLIGNLIIGDNAFRLYLDKARNVQEYVPINKRIDEYPKKAIEILQYGDPGSSAGGEQPKFPVVIGLDLTPALVKYSPKIESNIGQRWADLLICEHISLEVLKKCGQKAAKSDLIFSNDQVFLETLRFDRIGIRGRRGIISLGALDNEFIGGRKSWTESAEELFKQHLINKEVYDAIRWREIFGNLIGNTDMHLTNISFFFQMPKILGLAPVYDMLPMLYAPQNNQIIERIFNPPLPNTTDSDIWYDVLKAGMEFWKTVSVDTRISSEFRKIAKVNFEKVESLKSLQNLLP